METPERRALALRWIGERHRGNRNLEQRAMDALATLDERLVPAALGAFERLDARGPAFTDMLNALFAKARAGGDVHALLRAALIRLGAFASPGGEFAARELISAAYPLPWLVQSCGARAFEGKVFVPTSKILAPGRQTDELAIEQFAMTSFDPATSTIDHVPMRQPYGHARVGPMAYRGIEFVGSMSSTLVMEVRAISGGRVIFTSRFAFVVVLRDWMELPAPGEPNAPKREAAPRLADPRRLEVLRDAGGRWTIVGWPDLLEVDEALRAAVPSIGNAATATLHDAVEFTNGDGSVSLAIPANLANSAGPCALLVVLHAPRRDRA